MIRRRSKLTTWFRPVLAAACAVSLGCSDDDPSDAGAPHGPPGGILEADAGSIPLGEGGEGPGGSSGANGGAPNTAGASGAGAGGGSGGTGGSTGGAGTGGTAGSGAGGFRSNPPGIVVQQSTDVSGLVLLSSNLTQEPSGSGGFQQWFGEVLNQGARTVCFPQVTITFRLEGGALAIEFLSYADAPPYRGGSALTLPCLAPNGRGGFYSNELGDSIAIGSIRTATAQLTALEGTYIPHPAAPELVSATAGPHSEIGNTWWAVSGELRATSTIHNIGISVYPRSATTGLLLDRLTDTHLDNLFGGLSWFYETIGHDGERYTDFLRFVDFIEGPKTLLSGIQDQDAADPELARIHERWRAFRAETSQRAELARPLRLAPAVRDPRAAPR